MEFKDIFSQILSDQTINFVTGLIVLLITLAIIVLMIIYIIKLVLKEKDNIEILKRIGAIFIAFMVFIISIALKLSVPSVLFKTIEIYNPAFYGINLLTPAIIGYILSLYIMYQFRRARKSKDEPLIHRWILFIFSLSFLVSISIIYEAFKSEQNQSYSLLLVNGVFISALLFKPIFKLKDIYEDEDKSSEDNFINKVKGIFNRITKTKGENIS